MTLLPWLPLWLAFAVPIVWLTSTMRSRSRSAILMAHLIGVLCCALGDAVARRYVTATTAVSFSMTALYFADLTIVSYAGIVTATLMALARRRLAAVERRAVVEHERLTRARLRWLESQLQPHFLFNTISTILEVAEVSPPAARAALLQLDRSLRNNLRHDGPSDVPLAEELTDLDEYLAIQQLRFADWLVIERRIDAAAASLSVPRLLLQPLVENAIQHGLAGRQEPGVLLISADVTANGRLVLGIIDNGRGLDAPHRVTHERTGMSNVRARLETSFGSDFRFALESTYGTGTRTVVDLPARQVRRHATANDETASATAIRTPAEAPPLPTSPASWFSRHPVLSGALLWAAWGLFWSHQSYGYLLLRGRLGTMSYGDVLLRDGSAAMIWAALAVPIALVVRRSAAWQLALRVFAIVVTVAAGAALHGVTFLALFGSGVTWRALVDLLPLDLLLGTIAVLLSLRRSIEEWIAGRELRIARDGEAMARAELDTSLIRVSIETMQQDLVRAADLVLHDVDGAADILVKMADRLRVMVWPTRGEGATAFAASPLDRVA